MFNISCDGSTTKVLDGDLNIQSLILTQKLSIELKSDQFRTSDIYLLNQSKKIVKYMDVPRFIQTIGYFYPMYIHIFIPSFAQIKPKPSPRLVPQLQFK